MGGGYGSAILWSAAVVFTFVNPLIGWILVVGVWADLLWIATRRARK